ncbi:hypothetical protein [Noviherbaspirillum galbum]|uniref:Uncharacterized protein n=1 Tax=Noviherbaspirillum galbum TaxID=2709383 RepID=A0A6B3SH95_9BURK|nr:hypothetical protein [Noviherbaspirillum galbum]NEX60224.1 hypothetical protein [Noviherbaspirillum galbum]
MNTQQIDALQQLGLGVLEAVNEGGNLGAPAASCMRPSWVRAHPFRSSRPSWAR